MTNGSGYIGYYRVSTARQGASGLGLDAQRVAVARYVGSAIAVAECVEVESGRRSDRPELDRALAAARVHRVPVVVANVSRLTRSSSFLHRLLDAGVDVRFADLPQISGPTGRFLLAQMAAVAELEAGMISARTKAALAAAKARGQRLGTPGNLARQDVGRARAQAARTAAAGLRAGDLAPIVAEIRAAGAATLREVAAALNARGVRAARGGRWSASQVARIEARLVG